LYLAWLLCVLVLAVSGCAQSSAPSPPLVADKVTDGPVTPDTSNPNRVNAKDETQAPRLPAIPPLPEGKVSLLGGTILHVDHVRDRLTLQVFGGEATSVLFDERTRVFRDGTPASTDDLKEGVRAYLDTMLDGSSIFARNVRLVAALPAGQSSGQIVEIDPSTGELWVRDTLSPDPVKMRLGPHAAIFCGDQVATASDLRTGALVALTFMPAGEDLPQVSRISILASPGAQFVFAGHIEYLDLHRGLMVVVDPRDNKSYEVNLDPSTFSLTRDLREGADVTVHATFDGRRYEAKSITAMPPANH
jgi:hypothetical protein